MDYWKRLLLLSKRILSGGSLGIYFPGTQHFRLPKSFFTKKCQVKINAPHEVGLAWDFINVLIDDEYGLRGIIPPPKTVIDIGANIGLFSLWATRCFPSAQIHAYEPNPRITPFTQKNLDQCDVTLFKEAVSATKGYAMAIDNSESRLSLFKTGASEGIKTTTLEEAINRIGGNVDLLKLDCEGAEWEIFCNPEPFKKVKLVRMEYHLTEGRTVEDVKQFVNRIGFTTEYLEENSGFGIVWFHA